MRIASCCALIIQEMVTALVKFRVAFEIHLLHYNSSKVENEPFPEISP
jgi:hypothetical protein